MEELKKLIPNTLRQLLENTTVLKRDNYSAFIYGKTGCGKTTIIKKTYDYMRECPLFLGFEHVPELMLEFREVYRKKSENTESELIDKYCRNRFLFLDDFGAEKTTEYTTEAIYLILNRFEETGNTLVITSNYDLATIAETMSDRIASRIAGICKIFKLDDVDYRTKKDIKNFIVNDKNIRVIEHMQALMDYRRKLLEPKAINIKPADEPALTKEDFEEMHRMINKIGASETV